MFLDFLKKIFKKDKNMDEKIIPSTDQKQETLMKKRKHKLEIQVYEADWEDADRNNGQPRWKPVRSDPALDGGRPNMIAVSLSVVKAFLFSLSVKNLS